MTSLNYGCKEQTCLSESYNILIEKLLQSYKVGSAKPIESTPEMIGEQMNQKMGQQLFTRMNISLSNSEILRLNQAVITRSQSLNAARSGDFIKAETLMEEARNICKLGQLSPEGYLLYRAFQEPAEAYLDYRRGDFDKAWSRISEALAIDSLLETECGYKCLFAHRLHLIDILIRSEAKSTRKWKAMELAGQFLSYLQGTSTSLPFPIVWGSELVEKQPPEIIYATFAFVTSQISLIFAEEKYQQACDWFAIIESNLPLKFDVSDSCDSNYHPCPQALAWLKIKRAFLNKNVTDFLEYSSQFLVDGRSNIPVLWYVNIIDILEVLRELNFPNYNLVKQQVAEDAVSWKYVPKQLLPILLNES
jgi:hypothetical protein